MHMFQRIAIVGVGLIGGSIGLAVRERGLAGQVIGSGRRQVSLDKALACGAIEQASTDYGIAAKADLAIAATPIDSVIPAIRQLAAAAPETTR